jgi:hypothetical protein
MGLSEGEAERQGITTRVARLTARSTKVLKAGYRSGEIDNHHRRRMRTKMVNRKGRAYSATGVDVEN